MHETQTFVFVVFLKLTTDFEDGSVTNIISCLLKECTGEWECNMRRKGVYIRYIYRKHITNHIRIRHHMVHTIIPSCASIRFKDPLIADTNKTLQV